MATRQNKVKIMSKIAAVAGASAVLMVGGCTASEAPRLAALEQPATSLDTVPDGIELNETYGEIRYIGEAGDAMVFAAQAPTEQPWCVLVVLDEFVEDGDWVVGSACADDADFSQRGVEVSASGPRGESGAVLLLPDDFAGEVKDSQWRLVEPNLAVAVES